MDIFVHDAKELLTLKGFERPRRGASMRDLGIIKNGAVAIKDGTIVDVGRNITSKYRADVSIDASNKVVMPGFVDSHTHLVFAGSRAELLWKKEGWQRRNEEPILPMGIRF